MTKLDPNDPTPDPNSPPPASPPAPTTFHDVVDSTKTAGKVVSSAVSAGKKIAKDGKVNAEEVVDAALEVAEKLSLSQHTITELRKLLVPIITALIAAAAGGGIGSWQAGLAKTEAVREAEVRAEEIIQQAEDRAAELEKLRTEIRKAILKDASWDEISATLRVDEPQVMEALGDTSKLLKGSELTTMFRSELQQIQAQAAIPPRPGTR